MFSLETSQCSAELQPGVWWADELLSDKHLSDCPARWLHVYIDRVAQSQSLEFLSPSQASVL